MRSYDGVGGWNDWLRGINGAEKLTVRAFELCRDMGFKTVAGMMIHKGNRHTLRDTVNYLASLGVSLVRIRTVADMGGWTAHNENKQLSLKDFLQTMRLYTAVL